MKRILTVIAAALALAACFTVQAGCEGGSCVGHKGKFEHSTATAPVQP